MISRLMGMCGTAIAALCLVLFGFSASAAHAATPFERACLLASDSPLTMEQANASTAWTCPAQVEAVMRRHVWLRIPGDAVPDGPEVLVTEGSAVRAITLVRVASDGSQTQLAYDSRALRDRWIAATRFALPLPPPSPTGTQALYVGIDGAIAPTTATDVVFADSRAMPHETLVWLTMSAFLVGMMVLAMMYTLVLALTIRNRIAIAQFGYAVGVATYVASTSSLFFLLFPTLSLEGRSMLSYGGLALGSACLGPFLLALVEPRFVPEWMRRLVPINSAVLGSMVFLVPVERALGLDLHTIYLLAFVPQAAQIAWLSVDAARKGSTAAKLFLLSWTLPFLFAMDRLARGFGFYTLPTIFDFGFVGSLAVEAVMLAVTTGWRSMRLEREREEAAAEHERLLQVARTDWLTGLENRRAFESHHFASQEWLALIDLDHFKRLNDTHGHVVGDRVLAAVGGYLNEKARTGVVNHAWRLGGEEFAISLTTDERSKAEGIFDWLRRDMSARVKRSVPELDSWPTASVGFTRTEGISREQAYRSADGALYAAKRAGRDRTVGTS